MDGGRVITRNGRLLLRVGVEEWTSTQERHRRTHDESEHGPIVYIGPIIFHTPRNIQYTNTSQVIEQWIDWQ